MVVKDNLKSPLLVLHQPCLRAKEKETTETAYNGQHKVGAGDTYGMKHDPEKKRESKEKGIRDDPALHGGIPWKETTRKDRVFRERKTSQRTSASKRVSVVKGMLVVTGIHPSAPFINKKVSNLRISVRSSMLNRLDANRRNQTLLW